MAASNSEEGTHLLDEPQADFDVLSFTTSSSDSFSLCLSSASHSLTPSPSSSPHSPSSAGQPHVAYTAPSFAQWFTPLASPCQQQPLRDEDKYAAAEHGQLVFELEDDALIQSDLTSSLSPRHADVAIAGVIVHAASGSAHEQQQDEYRLAEIDEQLQRWDGDSDCSDVSSTFSDQFAFSTSLPATSNLPCSLPTFSSLPSSLPTLSAAAGSSTIVAQWLHFHGFPAGATVRLSGYTCSDLFALTKEDAKELLDVVEGIKLYHRIQACKQRAAHRTHARRASAIAIRDEYDCKYTTTDLSGDSSLHSSAMSSPRLMPPSAFTSAFQHRAQAAGLQYMAASAARCSVAGCGCGVVEPRRWLGCCVECGCSVCSVHACKSLWTSAVYCPPCYAADRAWVVGFCVIA